MTDGLDQLVANAGLALLTADAGLVVFDGAVPNPAPAPPYCVVFTTVNRPSEDPDNAADGRSRVWSAAWIVHSVGANAAAARAVAQRVRTQLLDVTPVISGLSCNKIRMDPDSPPPEKDETTGVVVMDAVSTYRLRATS
jgi:hypothetical protein